VRTELDSAAWKAAGELWEARLQGRLIAGLPDDCRPRTVAEGYACQAAMNELGGTRAGWKIAATAPGGREVLGVEHPFAGPLYERFAVPPGGSVEAGGLRMGVAEAEFAFSMGGSLAPRDAPHDRDAVLAAIGSFVPSIEIPDTRFEAHRSAGAPNLIADAACAGYFVAGRPVTDFDPGSLPASTVIVRNRETEVAAGVGANVLDDPVEAVVWLANELAAHGWGLEPGELVMTGAAAVVNPIAPGDSLEADFGEMGRVSVELR
jgi:2-keto-4-pentenoate hydratase